MEELKFSDLHAWFHGFKEIPGAEKEYPFLARMRESHLQEEKYFPSKLTGPCLTPEERLELVGKISRRLRRKRRRPK